MPFRVQPTYTPKGCGNALCCLISLLASSDRHAIHALFLVKNDETGQVVLFSTVDHSFVDQSVDVDVAVVCARSTVSD